MDYSITKLIFAASSFGVILLGGLVNWFEKYIPTFFVKVFRYGKFEYSGKVFGAIDMPKRWFKHFYVFAIFWSTLALCLATYVYFVSGKPLPIVNLFLNWTASNNRTAHVTATATYLSLVLLTIQCWKRFYETFFVSVFSDSKMNIIHYFIGYFHYFGAIIAILAEAPGFTNVSPELLKSSVRIDMLTWKDYVFGSVFLWACWNQLQSANILANLRKNKKGSVVSLKHSVPEGGLFDLLSAPHIVCEILMYVSLTVILWGNVTWLYACIWVLCNQVETAFLTHWWYQKTFKNYPLERCALIPFVL